MILAYLDAGSGAMLATAVVAGFAGAMVTIRVWWRRVRSAVGGWSRRGWGRLRGQPVEAPVASTRQDQDS